MRCYMHGKDTGDCTGPAIAVWKVWHNGFRAPFCKRHLDMWLDNADEEPELEPDGLEFLNDRQHQAAHL